MSDKETETVTVNIGENDPDWDRFVDYVFDLNELLGMEKTYAMLSEMTKIFEEECGITRKYIEVPHENNTIH